MNNPPSAILRIPDNIKDQTLNYRSFVERFLKGLISPALFKAHRVSMGIYEQRTAGRFMVRIRVGAGLVLPYQLRRIAELSNRYGNGITHVTTRQNIQIHEVNIEDTPDILEGLLEVGLSTRGGGGNTVRNVTACPEAGICPKEEFDVTPYAIALAEYLLQNPRSFDLPRKYKIAFSGCSADCALASVADLGFFAHRRNGARGFAVYAAGGLGSNPTIAAKIEDFINAKNLFAVAQAVTRLYDKHGDRAHKHKARLRYVLTRLGDETFIKLYQQEKATLKSDGLPYDPPEIRDIASAYPLPAAPVNVRVFLDNGDIPAHDLDEVGQIADTYGQGLIRTTQLQDLLITAVAQENTEIVGRELKKLSIDVCARGDPKIVACAGASTCKLGLCLSKGLSGALTHKFHQGNFSADLSNTIIRISGCANSCGHHYVADIGFQGRAKRVNGKLMPCYDVLIGARILEGEARLAQKIGTVPARQIPDLIAEAVRGKMIEQKQLIRLCAEYGDVSANSYPDEYYYDYGAAEPFSFSNRLNRRSACARQPGLGSAPSRRR